MGKEEYEVKGKMDGVKDGREVHRHTTYSLNKCQVLIAPLHQITTGGSTAACHPPPLSLPHPGAYRLPEDGALEVAPLHRNRICHGNQSLLLQGINMLPPGPWSP